MLEPRYADDMVVGGELVHIIDMSEFLQSDTVLATTWKSVPATGLAFGSFVVSPSRTSVQCEITAEAAGKYVVAVDCILAGGGREILQFGLTVRELGDLGDDEGCR